MPTLKAAVKAMSAVRDEVKRLRATELAGVSSERACRCSGSSTQS